MKYNPPTTSFGVPKENDNKKQPLLNPFLWKYAMFAFLVTWPSDHGPIQEYYKCTEETGFFIVMILKEKR